MYLVVLDVDCKLDTNGVLYKGKKNMTKSERTCQYWNKHYPHEHTFYPYAHNYCRYTDDSIEPWCFTTDPHVIWEYCDIPLCN